MHMHIITVNMWDRLLTADRLSIKYTAQNAILLFTSLISSMHPEQNASSAGEPAHSQMEQKEASK